MENFQKRKSVKQPSTLYVNPLNQTETYAYILDKDQYKFLDKIVRLPWVESAKLNIDYHMKDRLKEIMRIYEYLDDDLTLLNLIRERYLQHRVEEKILELKKRFHR